MSEDQQRIERRAKPITKIEKPKNLQELAQDSHRIGSEYDTATLFQGFKEAATAETDLIIEALTKGEITSEDAKNIISLQLAEARYDANIDQTTTLYNSLAIEKILEHEIESAKKDKSELTVAFLDIDYFKLINDTLGHNAGDQALNAWGGFLKTEIRDTDIAGRHGGEEVIIILPKTNEDGASILLDRIRKNMPESIREVLESLGYKYQNHVTMSVGITDIKAEEINSSESAKQIMKKILERADKNLYKAKESGRNIVYNDKGLISSSQET